MRFLVTGEWVEVGAAVPPQQMSEIVKGAVVPSLQMIANWEQHGKAKGGIIPGERKGIFVLDVESIEEVDHMLSELPFWGLVRWEVRPLQSISAAIHREERVVERLRAM